MAVLLCVGTFQLFERLVLRPVAQITDAHARLAAGDMSVRIAERGRDELADLARAFNHTVASLAQAELRFRTIFEAFPHPVLLSRLSDGTYLEMNAALASLYGRTRDELMGHSPRPGDDPETSRRAKERLLATGRVDNEMFHSTAEDGREAWLTYSARVVELGGEQVAVTVITDLSELKRTEAALAASEHRYRSLVEGMKDIVYALDADTRVTFIGPQVLQYGYAAEEVEGRGFADFVFEDDREAVLGDFRHTLAYGDNNRSSTFRILTKSGATAWIEESGRAVHDAGGRIVGVSGLLRDVTDRKQADQEKQALQGQLFHAQKMEAIGHLAGGVAHDFNNILSATLMQVEMLREEHSLPPDVLDGIKEVESQAKRAAALTRQLLLFSRRQVVQAQVLDLNSLLGNLLKMLRRLIGEHVMLEFGAAPGDLWVDADPGMLEQVVTNLVVNARDAMPSGGHVTIRTQLAVIDAAAARANPDARAGRFVQLEVADTGCGMDAATMEHIFEPFFTTKAAGKGTGLGLATVFGIVAQHRGWVEVRSEVGRGSTFDVFLPECEQPAVRLADASTLLDLPRGYETLLVVEDEATVRRLIVGAFQRLGYHVLEAGDGREALQIWDQHRDSIRLVVTDLVMPGGLSGLDLADRMLGEKAGLHVILMSGYSIEMVERGLPRSRSVHFLQKPLEAAALARLVRECLDA